MKRQVLYIFLLVLFYGSAVAQERSKERLHQVADLKITTLSTMLANKGIGEWGYSALIESEGRKLLFDTGSRPETVLQNAQELGIDLSDVEDVYLSHNHWDHIGGL
ncbi:MBL fold metallo-hydrolase, partial [Algoriphagus sp.]|uniref:MBL fold metallo-hydrolase n=1 Tax=Algoriphagus sp. TaxID=1872435 RepID=UPI0025E24509